MIFIFVTKIRNVMEMKYGASCYWKIRIRNCNWYKVDRA